MPTASDPTPGRRVRRSVLFVPAVRPDRFAKAVATGADAVCLDLEDGVSFAQKDEALDKALALLADRPPVRAEVVLRINEPESDLGERDLDALLASGVRPDALMVPKVGGPDTLRALERRLEARVCLDAERFHVEWQERGRRRDDDVGAELAQAVDVGARDTAMRDVAEDQYA